MKYLDLAIANETIKTTPIKGKDYAEVAQRLKAFRMVYPQGSIPTEIIKLENGIVVMKASAYTDDGKLLATGTAYEKEDSSFINQTSYIENCETSAVGRALGNAGFGIDVSVASAEEVQSAMANQTVTQEEANNYKLTLGKYTGKTIKEVFEKDSQYIEWILGNKTDERLLKIIELTTGLVIPSEEEQAKTLELMSKIKSLSIQKMVEPETICEKFGVKDIKDLTIEQMEKCIIALEKKEE